MKVITETCLTCHKTVCIHMNADDYNRWKSGAFIQDALPYLSEAEREFLISRTCEECFDAMFAEEEEYA